MEHNGYVNVLHLKYILIPDYHAKTIDQKTASCIGFYRKV